MISTTQIDWLNQIGGRRQLEDSIFPRPGTATEQDRLFIVCDGIGGEKAGEIASQIVSEEFARHFAENPPGEDEVAVNYYAPATAKAVERIRAYIATNAEAARMGTTIALVYLNTSYVAVAWCGDSRVYHIRDGAVQWRTTDHSVVGDLIRAGKLNEQQARHHPHKNVLMRAITASGTHCDIDVYNILVQTGDQLLVCSDGLLENIDDAALEEVFRNPALTPFEYFRTYCHGQSGDNYSMYLISLKVSEGLD